MRIGRIYHFESAHWLPNVPSGHKCGTMHGHNYKLEIVVLGALDLRGFVMDFAELDAIVTANVLFHVDHQTLNQVDGLANPTAENIVSWVVPRLRDSFQSSQLVKVRVWENDRCFAEWGTALG